MYNTTPFQTNLFPILWLVSNGKDAFVPSRKKHYACIPRLLPLVLYFSLKEGELSLFLQGYVCLISKSLCVTRRCGYIAAPDFAFLCLSALSLHSVIGHEGANIVFNRHDQSTFNVYLRLPVTLINIVGW